MTDPVQDPRRDRAPHPAAVAIADDVAAALAGSDPVVALESTIFSHLGLPSPHNREALARCLTAVTSGGATPALTAVVDGTATVGISADRHELICGPARKVAARDLAIAVAQAWPYGATTVSASLCLAAAAGIEVFATGGIGGVHRDAARTGDISADLDALARYPVVTVSAGAKVFLDLPRTLEHLEMASVPVLGWGCDHFPAFHARSSGLPLSHRVNSPAEVAAIARAHWNLGGGGVLVVAPVPEAHALPLEEVEAASIDAIRRAEEAGAAGAGVTPAVLAGMADATSGRVIGANLALAEHNAGIATAIATALTRS